MRAIVTTGPAVPAQDLRVPENVELHSYLPHTDVLPTVSMVIGHGGHGTTMAALSYIVLPMARFTDQFKIGQALEKASAGQLLPKRSSPSRIRQAIEQVLGDERYRSAASRLALRSDCKMARQSAPTQSPRCSPDPDRSTRDLSCQGST